MDQEIDRDQPLRGKRILIADDEFIIAMCIEDTLRDAGADVINVGTLRDALAIATAEPLSAALLDVRLGQQTTEQVADRLAERHVPFLFYSGQALPDQVRERHPETKLLLKPCSQDVFVSELLKIIRD